MSMLEQVVRKVALDALNRLEPNYGETHVVGSIYVAMWNQAALTVTVAGTEYGPYGFDDARDAIIKHIEAQIRKEQPPAVPA